MTDLTAPGTRDKRGPSDYVGLVRELALTDLKLKYQGSIVGYLWSFAKPLVLFAVLFFVFTQFVRLGSAIERYPLYLLLGIVMWSYFAESTLTAMSSVVDRADLIRKVYFPRIVIVIAASVSTTVTLLLNLLIVMIFAVIFGPDITFSWLAFILLLVQLWLLALGWSLVLAALYVRFRDLRHIWEVVLQVGFYASPIIYPLDIIPERYQGLVLLNPVAQIIQDARELLVTPETITTIETVESAAVLFPYLFPAALVAVGYAYFQRAAAQFAEEV